MLFQAVLLRKTGNLALTSLENPLQFLFKHGYIIYHSSPRNFTNNFSYTQELETALRIVEREEMADEECSGNSGVDLTPPGRPKRWRERAIAMLQVMIPYSLFVSVQLVVTDNIAYNDTIWISEKCHSKQEASYCITVTYTCSVQGGASPRGPGLG